MEAVECGAAALGSLLAYYGRRVPLEELRVACGVSRDGVRASAVVRGARAYHLDMKGLKLELDEALALPPPYLVFWNFNHFIVFEGRSGKRVFVNDPASGPRTISVQDFSNGFTGVVLQGAPGPDFTKGGKRPSVLKSLWQRTQGSKDALAHVAGTSFLIALAGLLLPFLLKVFVDEILVRSFTDWLFPLLVGIALAAILNGLLVWMQQRDLLKLQVKFAVILASQFFWHVLRVPVVFYTQRYVGDVATRVQSASVIASLLAGPLPSTLVSCLMVFVYGGVMALYSVELTLIATGLTALNLLVLRLVQRKRRDLSNVQLNVTAKLAGASMAGLQAIETIKASGTESDFFRIWSGYQTNNLNMGQRLGRVSLSLNMAPTLLGHLTTAAVLGVGAWQIMTGNLTVGALVAFQAMMGNFVGPIQQLVSFGSQLQDISGHLNRLDDVLAFRTDPVLAHDDPQIVKLANGSTRLTGRLDLTGLTFGYSPLDPPLIEDFSLTLHPGQRVALVGSTGSGKSTVGHLVLGLYEPAHGQVHYDGQDIKEIPRTVFAASVASVDQEIFLFEGTVHDNLTLWDANIPRSAVVEAAKDACIHDVVAARPGGYDSVVEEGGGNFSGGQRQRLEIARALVRNPSILVLDEATASLDPLTEQEIDQNLRRRGITCIIIAHRLSTIRDCDEIIVMDAGKIVERGTHSSLTAAKGRYAELVAAA
jgi:NHLM bacteriocin system ABC transporter peptidase/ATP-binding protein